MFKSAATKIAHNTTIPALAGHSDLRPLQDLITAEKGVLTTLQKLRMDLVKAGDALRIWGQGEGDDLGDILTASSTILLLFSTALTTYSSLHHTIRDCMKSVRSREEALDDLRRRRRRVGANAEAAEKKLSKMSPEHKNLAAQTDILKKLREEMRVMDGEIIREEAELGDFKRKSARDWMGFKLGGLVECCEKGVIAGDIGRQIIQFIPGDVTQPGLPRAYYNAHGRVGDLVAEAQRAVSQVTFSTNTTGRVLTSAAFGPQALTAQEPAVQSPFLPTPSLGSELTLGATTYNPPPGPPQHRRASVDELAIHTPPERTGPQFSSLPTKMDPIPASSSVDPTQPISLSTPYDSGTVRTEENQTLMASIVDALSQSHRGFTLEDATSLGHTCPDEPVPKYEPITAQSEPHGPVTNGRATSLPLTEEREGPRRAARRSTSPTCLPPGAAPAAIRAWDDRMGQGEDGAHSDRPISSSPGSPSQRLTSSSERDGEEEDGLAYDRDSRSFDEDAVIGGDGKHRDDDDRSIARSGRDSIVDVVKSSRDSQLIQRTISTGAISNAGSARPLSRAPSQWRIPRVPPPSMDADVIDAQESSKVERQNPHNVGTSAREDEDMKTDESAEERARSAAAAREVSREMDALAFSAIAPSSGYATPRAPPPYPRSSSPSLPSLGKTPPSSSPPSPMLPPNPPFANRGRGMPAMMEIRHPGHVSRESLSGRLAAPTPVLTTSVSGGGGLPSPTAPRSTSPMYRSPPPEYPRLTPPFSTPPMASSSSPSSSSLNVAGGASPGGTPRTISAAAFRRQQARSPSAVDAGPADTSPLTLRKPSGSPVPPPAPVPKDVSKPKLSVMNPDMRASDEGEGEELNYIKAYGGEGAGAGYGAGYGAGRYVSDLERH